MNAAFRVELLAGQPRSAFRCGEAALDRYLATQATQDMRRRVSACFVAVEVASGEVAGFYTLAAASVPVTDLPESLTRRLRHCPAVPVARVGRLAVAALFQGRHLGAALLADAKDDTAAAFCRHHGFVGLATRPRVLVMPLARLKAPSAD